MSTTDKQNLSTKILSDITVHSKYARYVPELQRRENWNEIVTRNKTMHINKFPELKEEIEKHYQLVLDKKVLPSMRSLQFAGKPIEVNPTRVFNCAYLPIDNLQSFPEICFCLLSGTGIGFSVQRHHVEQLPDIRKPLKRKRFVVGDSIEGWADSIKLLMKAYLGGKPLPIFDYRDIRQKGERLITSGGKAPGPDPLKECHFQIQLILDRKKDGEKLLPIECHDIICHIADCVLAGGIRRAALISLFDFDDEEMIGSKSGSWWELNPQRGRANNSAVILRNKIKKEEFIEFWEKIKNSGAGEPGIYFTNDKDWGTNPCCLRGDTLVETENERKTIKQIITDISSGKQVMVESFNIKTNEIELKRVISGRLMKRDAEIVKIVVQRKGKDYVLFCTDDHKIYTERGYVQAKNLVPSDKIMTTHFAARLLSIEKVSGKHDVFDIEVEDNHNFFANGILVHNCEIALRPNQFCNLTTINASNIESQEDFEQRVEAAVFIGTLQASYSDFHYLRDIWKKTTEKDALLGVSMTGIASKKVFDYDFDKATKAGIKINEETAKKIGINKAARIFTIKPEGTSSLVLGCASGVHAYHGPFYIRRLRIGKNEALYSYLSIYHPELLEDEVFKPTQQSVLSIPIKSPDNSIYRDEPALEMLERVKFLHTNWIKPGHRKGENTHNVSATISLKDEEWDEVGSWMWENKTSYNGLSVLPYNGGTYAQTPYEDMTEEQYNNMLEFVTNIDLDNVIEIEDKTSLVGELACAGGACEIL